MLWQCCVVTVLCCVVTLLCCDIVVLWQCCVVANGRYVVQGLMCFILLPLMRCAKFIKKTNNVFWCIDVIFYIMMTDIIPNYNQQDATFLDLFISIDAVHISGGFSAHHQEYITVHTAAGIVKQCYCVLLSWMKWNKQQYWLTIPEAVCTVMCSWWWVEELPETCRASVEINKKRNNASYWL